MQRLDNLLSTRHSLLHELARRGEDAADGDSLDACRVHGVVKVNKVAGNLHITAGKSLPLVGGGHAHLNFFGLAGEWVGREGVSRASLRQGPSRSQLLAPHPPVLVRLGRRAGRGSSARRRGEDGPVGCVVWWMAGHRV